MPTTIPETTLSGGTSRHWSLTSSNGRPRTRESRAWPWLARTLAERRDQTRALTSSCLPKPRTPSSRTPPGCGDSAPLRDGEMKRGAESEHCARGAGTEASLSSTSPRRTGQDNLWTRKRGVLLKMGYACCSTGPASYVRFFRRSLCRPDLGAVGLAAQPPRTLGGRCCGARGDRHVRTR